MHGDLRGRNGAPGVSELRLEDLERWVGEPCWYGFFKLLLPDANIRLVQGLTLAGVAATLRGLARLLRGGLEP